MFKKIGKRAVSLAAALAVLASVPVAVTRMNMKAAAEVPLNAEHNTVSDETDTDTGHDWASSWTTNDEGHWHECVRKDEGCNGISDAGEHGSWTDEG